VPYYPAFLDLRQRSALIVGGGPAAAGKIDRLLAAGARVTVLAADAEKSLRDLAGRGRIVLERRGYRPGDLRGYDLALVASDDSELQAAIARDARAERVWLNVIDAPDRCTFIAPAILDRGDLQVAVGTSGGSPALAARLRDRIGELFGDEFVVVLDIHRRLRERLRANERPAEERHRILRAVAASDLAERVRAGDATGIDRLLAELVDPATDLAALGVELPSMETATR
jgi:siroheme synthase-like protein